MDAGGNYAKHEIVATCSDGQAVQSVFPSNS